tara:strand:+ start:224 stop:679 length:456 start_codon:yes stop_codon:yes gene_type:complete
MNKKFVVIVFSILFLLTSMCLIDAYGDGTTKKHKKGLEKKVLWKAHFFLKNQDELKLSDEQMRQIKDLKVSVKKDLVKRKAEIDLIKIDIKSALYEETINTEAINKLIDQKYDLKRSKAKYLVSKYAALKSILTDEQAKEVKALWKKCDKN